MNINYIKLILFGLIISLAFADDCSVIKEILTQNNVEISWSPSNSTGCCSHEGIGCGNDSRINKVDFSSKGYSGNLSSIMSLEKLQYLSLSNCKFTGTIPSSIKDLTDLQFFIANGNQLTGTIPNEIGNANVQFIDLSNNQLEGQIPSFGKNTLLQSLNLSNNKLSGNVPSSFSNLKNIQKLYLSGNSQLSGELPNMSDTLKECNFDSTLLCMNSSRNHCTSGLKSCDAIKTETKQEVPTETNEPTSTPSTSPTLGPEDFNDSNKPTKNDSIVKWIGLAFVILLVICIIILFLICCKRRYKKPVVIEKPVPGHSTTEIFEDEYVQSYDGSEDPDASIQIHSLSRPQQHTVVPVHDGVSQSQTSSYDETSLYESVGGKSSNYGSLHSINHGRSPVLNSHSIINQGVYSTNSLNRNQVPGTPADSIEQDLGDIIITNGSIMSDNSHMIATTSMATPPPKRIPTNITSYSKSQSSPNLVRMNRYSVSQASPPNGAGKRRLTNVSTHTGVFNESPKLASASSSPSIDGKRSKHSSIPYPVSPFAIKSSSINTNQRKTYDTKRLSTSNDEAIHHNTIHVVNSRKSIPYPIEKSPTTVTKITNYSENTSTSNSNSIHSSTPIMSKNKNRTSLPPMNTKKPSILTKFSSQNNMNVSPLANNMDNNYDMPSASDSNDQYRVSNNKTSLNPSTISTNTSNSLNDNSKVNTLPKNNTSHIQDNSYNSDDNGQHQINTSLDTHNTSSNQSSLYNTTIKDTPANTNNNIEIYENPTEEIYVENPENGEMPNSGKTGSMASEDYKQYEQDMYNETYDYENIPEDLRQQIEEPQPPNYEEVFSESMYSPYVDSNNDEAIRMQLEMRRIEERQTRMEYLQRQIDNPELTNAQRQKYIDALDRLMLE